MPDAATLALFITAALSLNLTPGPDMLYVVARSVGQGRGAGVVSVLGLGVGYLFYTLVTASGLAALLTASPLAFNAVRVAGALYLAYLGLRTLLSREAADSPAALKGEGLRSVFRQGALTSTLNPSIALFFVALLPQFADPARGSVALQMALLGLVFVTTATTCYTLLALLAGSAGDWLKARPGLARGQRWFAGLLLIALGARVLLPGG